MDAERPTDGSWNARPVLAAGLRAAATIVPVLASLALTVALRRVVRTPDEAWMRLAWALALLLIAVATAIGVERLARRLMPLVTLLKLSMLFPDRAPSRFAIARQAGSVGKLEAQLAEDDGQGEASWTAAKILSLCVALRSHDRRTRGHAERVRVFTDLLGEELELSEDDRYRLRWAALLHDIGKLTVSPRILNKPGALDDGEWVKIKAHPATGARIAGPLLAWLGPWGDAIVQHHERYDGKGYPAGLAGAQISRAGRIVAVADCYDTMTAARSYKKPMAVWAARRELADCAGGQFDPEIVRAFLSISLPKLLWRTGPISFVIQLPFLWRLQEVGLQSVTAVTQGATVATVAAGVTALTAVGPVHAETQDRAPVRDRAATATAVTLEPAQGGQPSGGQPAPEPAPTATPAPQPSPSPGEPVPSPTPSGTPSPTVPPRPTPTRTPPPSPSPSPTRTPEPSPTRTPEPLPIPLPTSIPTLPPLPLPTLSPLPSLPPLPLPTRSPVALETAERTVDDEADAVASSPSHQQL